MVSSSTIKVIAFNLLVAFSLNTLLGFACSLGIDMGYNSKHHHSQSSISSQATDKKKGCCTEGQNSTRNMKTDHEERSESPNDQDCCSNGVVNFLKLDKNISSSVTVEPPVSVILFVVQFTYQIQLLEYIKSNLYSTHRFTRRHHPPIPDIRISIQSFLI